jgi:hypothetical protein
MRARLFMTAGLTVTAGLSLWLAPRLEGRSVPEAPFSEESSETPPMPEVEAAPVAAPVNVIPEVSVPIPPQAPTVPAGVAPVQPPLPPAVWDSCMGCGRG